MAARMLATMPFIVVDRLPVGTILRPETHNRSTGADILRERDGWYTASPRAKVAGYTGQEPGSTAALLSRYSHAVVVFVPGEQRR